MNRWLIRLLFVLAVGGVMGSAVWNNIATNRLIEQATGTDRTQQTAALTALAQRDDFFDLLQSRRLPARLRVAEGVEAMNNADGVKIALAMLRDPDPRVRDRFLESLKRIGKENLAAVAEGLKNGDAKVRNGTVQVMGCVWTQSLRWGGLATAAPSMRSCPSCSCLWRRGAWCCPRWAVSLTPVPKVF
jgi:hypothetical protein